LKKGEERRGGKKSGEKKKKKAALASSSIASREKGGHKKRKKKKKIAADSRDRWGGRKRDRGRKRRTKLRFPRLGVRFAMKKRGGRGKKLQKKKRGKEERGFKSLLSPEDFRNRAPRKGEKRGGGRPKKKKREKRYIKKKKIEKERGKGVIRRLDLRPLTLTSRKSRGGDLGRGGKKILSSSACRRQKGKKGGGGEGGRMKSPLFILNLTPQEGEGRKGLGRKKKGKREEETKKKKNRIWAHHRSRERGKGGLKKREEEEISLTSALTWKKGKIKGKNKMGGDGWWAFLRAPAQRKRKGGGD